MVQSRIIGSLALLVFSVLCSRLCSSCFISNYSSAERPRKESLMLQYKHMCQMWVLRSKEIQTRLYGIWISNGWESHYCQLTWIKSGKDMALTLIISWFGNSAKNIVGYQTDGVSKKPIHSNSANRANSTQSSKRGKYLKIYHLENKIANGIGRTTLQQEFW